MNKTLQGAVIAIVLQIISLALTFQIFNLNFNYSQLKTTILDGKAFVFLAAIATIPNILLFFYKVNRNQLNFAKGVQLIIILILLTLVVIKFT